MEIPQQQELPAWLPVRYKSLNTHIDNSQGDMQRVQCVSCFLSLFQQGSAGNPGGLPLPFPRSGPMDFGPNKRRRF